MQTPEPGRGNEEISPRCLCCICEQEVTLLKENKLKTTKLCILILRSLKKLHPMNDYFSLKKDIYLFIKNHWNILGKIKLFQKPNWKKCILDALNHCSSIESGKDVFHYRGYYRLCDEKSIPTKEILFEKDKIKEDLFNSIDVLSRQIETNIKLLNLLYHEIPFKKNDRKSYDFIITTRDILERQKYFYQKICYSSSILLSHL
ncbi:hypothetical protein EDI_129820 [Entamoeba dispar SAW760]|uniref:Uncharacterized protein n=1 Tax=Entamoeba dispar (strain ATCC PRA-260 / SAW760) TaxID=370354 RepID=B0EDN5_ENTDS|nr:uncharacterized protein EDI_129820 [Entamoeba dispar SAW760]EDR27355.1 hypothetical protein EDI_129820 [Entamoeba dispar SAW760]|eukprot:EDR27355.1 hypothetical protein EDI_129820 [Entamoeba dispar SAW760]